MRLNQALVRWRRVGRVGVATTLLVLGGATAILATPPVVAGVEAARFHLEPDPGGGGYWLADRTLWLAGDATLNATVREHEDAAVELDDISLLARYEATPRLSFFAEGRLENTVRLERGRNLRLGAGDLAIERLYADVILAPSVVLRVGKVLTPFGLWNVIRRAPLSWTVERPPVTEGRFPQHVTGLSLTYQTTWSGWSVDATAYGPAQNKLAFRRQDEDGLIGGGRAAVGHALGPAFATVGLNGATFEEERSNRWAQTFGVDGEIDGWGHQVTGELVYTNPRGPRVARELGLYLQDAIPVVDKLYLILRLDYIEPRIGFDSVGGLTGIFWRPVPSLIVKLNYQFASHASDTLAPGFLAAVSLFF